MAISFYKRTTYHLQPKAESQERTAKIGINCIAMQARVNLDNFNAGPLR